MRRRRSASPWLLYWRAAAVSWGASPRGSSVCVRGLSSSYNNNNNNMKRGVVGHQRYLLYQPAASSPSSSAAPPPQPPHRPLILLAGTAQTTHQWESHLFFLATTGNSSNARDVLICEPLGVGRPAPPAEQDLSLPAQAVALRTTLDAVFGPHGRAHAEISSLGSPVVVDLCGFSLGGRIAMAFACLYPAQIHRLHLTGVSLRRSPWGLRKIQSWKDHLHHDNDKDNDGGLRAFAWSALRASYSPAFLMRQQDKLPLWVDSLCQGHTVDGLRRLVEQTHAHVEGNGNDDNDDVWSVAAMADRLRAQKGAPQRIGGSLCVGAQDPLSPVEQVEALATVLGWPAPTVIQDAAHVPPIENPRAWRADVGKCFLMRPP
jgi:pimeloyl-ACP methyl ester carboxylesterase